VKAGSLPLT
jgi:hypothetical protein